MIRDRGKLVGRCHKMGKRIKLSSAYFCFKWWSGAYWKARYYAVTGFAPPWLTYVRALSWQTAAAMRSQINKVLREDFAVAASSRQLDVDAALCTEDPRRAFQAVRALKPRPPTKHWRVTAADGTPASDYVQERQVFREHFGKLLFGAPTIFEKLDEKERVHAP